MEIILSLVIFMLCALGLSLGVIFKRGPLKGSCGGIGGANCSCARGETDCATDGKADNKVENLSYNAAKH